MNRERLLRDVVRSGGSGAKLWLRVIGATAVVGLAGVGGLLSVWHGRERGYVSVRGGWAAELSHRIEIDHPNVLWHVVHDVCVPNMKFYGRSVPCAEVNIPRGYAIIKDVEHRHQYLLIPTQRIPGIEAPALLASGAPNYWDFAWQARRYLMKDLSRPVPRVLIGLAVNSVAGRTQNQLHIHLDCVRADTRGRLLKHQREIGETWSTLKFDLLGRFYRARWLPGAELGDNNPFKLLAEGDPLARSDMGEESLTVIGAERNGAPGFIVLSDRTRSGVDGQAVGERLLDNRCAAMSGAAAS